VVMRIDIEIIGVAGFSSENEIALRGYELFPSKLSGPLNIYKHIQYLCLIHQILSPNFAW
jgi:hypothetical protein